VPTSLEERVEVSLREESAEADSVRLLKP